MKMMKMIKMMTMMMKIIKVMEMTSDKSYLVKNCLWIKVKIFKAVKRSDVKAVCSFALFF